MVPVVDQGSEEFTTGLRVFSSSGGRIIRETEGACILSSAIALCVTGALALTLALMTIRSSFHIFFVN